MREHTLASATYNNNNNNTLLIVHYPMQFSGPPRNIRFPCSTLLAHANGGSTNTTRVHGLLLPSKHY